ncbi:MAG: hypothetical protein AAGI71_10960 [Bacteroidota bacterium]
MISPVTGQTAEGANQIATASQNLRRLMENLDETIRGFQLESHEGVPA